MPQGAAARRKLVRITFSSLSQMALQLSKLDVDGFDLPAEGEWRPVEIVKRNRRTEILSDIEGLARREGAGHRPLDLDAQRLPPSTAMTTSAGAAGLAILVSTDDAMLAGLKGLGRAADIALDHHHVVFVNEMTLFHVERQAAGDSAERVKNAGRVFADVNVHGHAIALASDRQARQTRAAASSRIEAPAAYRAP